MKRFATAFVLVISYWSLVASSPALEANTKINYQGKLINGTNLVNGITTNVFRLYDTGGIQLYSETQSVAVVDGLYSARIGEQQPAFYNALTNPIVYLEVQVNGIVLSPREQLFSAPYAVNAVKRSGDTMTGPLSIEAGAGSNLVITSSGSDIAIGSSANGDNSGIAIGSGAEGVAFGVGVGNAANGTDYAVALGRNADAAGKGVSIGSQSYAYEQGAALGYNAGASGTGTAVGAFADGAESGVAVGYSAMGQQNGTAVGNDATGDDWGIAIGRAACGAHTNIAVGYMAAAGIGPERIAIGHAVNVPQDNAAAIRGTLFLDGGSNVYFRTNFGSGAWTSLGGGESATGFVRKSGDTMTGVLSVSTNIYLLSDEFRVASLRHMLSIKGGDDVEIGNSANAYISGAAVGYQANGYSYGSALGYAANGLNYGTAIGYMTTGHTFGTAVGSQSLGTNRGTAVGYTAKGSDYGAALGYNASGYNYGAALGNGSGGRDHGAAIGNGAAGYDYGAAVGDSAQAIDHGAAVGNGALGSGYSAAIGYGSYGYANSVAIGNTAKAYNSNIAIGVFACAINDLNIIAIGEYVTNDRPNSARMRGTLYLDGATSILYRTTFGTGPWSNLLSTAEVDPKWTAASNGMQTQIDAKLASNTWAAANPTTNYVKRTGDTMSGPLSVPTNVVFSYAADRGAGAYSMLTIGGGGCIEIGSTANGYLLGAAIGFEANGYNMGTAVGNNADGRHGVAIGYAANGFQGVAAGNNAFAGGINRVAIGPNASNSVDDTALIRGTLYLDGATGILYRATFGSGTWFPVGSSSNTVLKTGDTMSGALSITSSNGLRIGSTSNNIAIGSIASAPESDAIAMGQSAAAYSQSEAIGSGSLAATGSVAVGYSASASASGVAIGSSADAAAFGVAVGMQADGSTNGVALGYSSDASPGGVAAGYQADAYSYGAALGNTAHATNQGIAIGYFAVGPQTNIAIGVRASANGDKRIAIGHNETNNVDNSALIRGNLYLDGATNVMIRTAIGSGNWSNLVHGVSESVTVVTNVVQQKSGGNVTNIVLQTDNWIFWNGLRIQ